MPVTTKTPLGAVTLNRKWRVDVNTGTTETPVWVPLRGIGEFTPTTEYTTQDTSDFDSEGFQSTSVTALGWGLEATVQRKTTAEDEAAYDAAQEALRLASEVMGLGNVVPIRYYEDNGPTGPKVQAYAGNVGVQWSEGGGDMTANSTATVTLMGQGRRVNITHPADAA